MANDEPLIRRLEKGDERSGFCSGNADLDRFFQRYAGQNQFRHHIGTSYIAVGAGQVIGFVTVSPGEISSEDLPADLRTHLPHYPLPILRLSRLAVDRRHQGNGIGRALLHSVL